MCKCVNSNIMTSIKLWPFFLRDSYCWINNTSIKIKCCLKIIFVKKFYKTSVFNLSIIIAKCKNLELSTWEYFIFLFIIIVSIVNWLIKFNLILYNTIIDMSCVFKQKYDKLWNYLYIF